MANIITFFYKTTDFPIFLEVESDFYRPQIVSML